MLSPCRLGYLCCPIICRRSTRDAPSRDSSSGEGNESVALDEELRRYELPRVHTANFVARIVDNGKTLGNSDRVVLDGGGKQFLQTQSGLLASRFHCAEECAVGFNAMG